MQRDWMSQIKIPKNCLRFWEEVMHPDDYLATFRVEFDPRDIMLATGGIYSTGVGVHSDPDNKPRSALLILHNDGFVVQQDGLSANQIQIPGKILILHTHQEHSLIKINPIAQKWAAVFLDYDENLSSAEIETLLAQTTKRIFDA